MITQFFHIDHEKHHKIRGTRQKALLEYIQNIRLLVNIMKYTGASLLFNETKKAMVS